MKPVWDSEGAAKVSQIFTGKPREVLPRVGDKPMLKEKRALQAHVTDSIASMARALESAGRKKGGGGAFFLTALFELRLRTPRIEARHQLSKRVDAKPRDVARFKHSAHHEPHPLPLISLMSSILPSGAALAMEAIKRSAEGRLTGAPPRGSAQKNWKQTTRTSLWSR